MAPSVSTLYASAIVRSFVVRAAYLFLGEAIQRQTTLGKYVSVFSHPAKNPSPGDSSLDSRLTKFSMPPANSSVECADQAAAARPVVSPLSTTPCLAERGTRNTRSRYLRISAGSFAIPAAEWEGVDREQKARRGGADRGERYGVPSRVPYSRGGLGGPGGGRGSKQRDPLSRGACNSILKAHRVNIQQWRWRRRW